MPILGSTAIDPAAIHWKIPTEIYAEIPGEIPREILREIFR